MIYSPNPKEHVEAISFGFVKGKPTIRVEIKREDGRGFKEYSKWYGYDLQSDSWLEVTNGMDGSATKFRRGEEKTWAD